MTKKRKINKQVRVVIQGNGTQELYIGKRIAIKKVGKDKWFVPFAYQNHLDVKFAELKAVKDGDK